MKDTYVISKPDYHHSILNVSVSILKSYGGKSEYVSNPLVDHYLKESKKHVVYMLLDGMGVNILEEHLQPDDFLRRHQKEVITSVFPPTTVAATHAVLTCKPPLASGYLGWVQYFKKEDSNCVVFLNEDFYDIHKILNENLKDKYLSYQSIHEQIEEVNKDVKTYELFPSFRKDGFSTFHLHLKRLSEIINKDEKNFTYVYWTDPDLTEHEYGIHHDHTKKVLKDLNDEVERFSETMNKDTILIIIADHGLVDVEGIDLFKDKELFSMLIRKPSIEPRATNFFVKTSKIRAFKTYFNQTYGDHFILYSKKEMIKSGLLGTGKKHPILKQSLGNYLAISTSKYMFNSKDKSTFKAHHAGLTKGEMEVPLIIYNL